MTIQQVAKKHNLTVPQLELLTKAARKYEDYMRGDLHKGGIQQYGVMAKTISSLMDLKMIQSEYMYSKEERDANDRTVLSMIDSAQRTFADKNAWREVMSELTHASKIAGDRDIRVVRITDAGRAIVREIQGLGWEVA